MSAARSKKRSKSGGGPSGGASSSLASLSPAMQDCHTVLAFLQSKPEASAYLEPVDWQAYGLADYPEIIQKPMDLGTVQGKLEENKYKSIAQFESDVILVFDNAMRYNRPDSEIYATADKLKKVAERKLQKVKESHMGAAGSAPGAQDQGAESTRADRLKLSQLVNQLTPEQLGRLVEMIQEKCPDSLNEDDDEEIEIEINNIDAKTLQELNAYSSKCIANSAANSAAGDKSAKKQKISQ